MEDISVNRELEVHFIDSRVTFQSDGKEHEVSFSDQLNEKLSSAHRYRIENETHMVQTLTDEALKRLLFCEALQPNAAAIFFVKQIRHELAEDIKRRHEIDATVLTEDTQSVSETLKV